MKKINNDLLKPYEIATEDNDNLELMTVSPGEEGIHIIPLYENFIFGLNGLEISVSAEVKYNGQRILLHEFSAGKIGNISYVKKLVGDRYGLMIKDDEFDSIVSEYHSILAKLKKESSRHIYECMGFVDSETVVVGNYLIKADSVEAIYRNTDDKLPDYKLDVSLPKVSDYVKNVMLKLIKEQCTNICWLCYKCLSFFTPMLSRAGHSCNMMLAVIGKTQVRKSSSTRAFYDPQNLPILQMSFTDTAAAIRRSLNGTGGMVCLLDDLAHGGQKNITMLENTIRLVGDTQAGGKRVIGNNISRKNVTPFIVLTGEFMPTLQNSSIARMIVTELTPDSVNKDVLTIMQNSPERTIAADVFFIQTALRLSSDQRSQMAEDFRNIRNSLSNEGIVAQARFCDAAAWMLVAADFINRALGEEVIDLLIFKQDLCKLLNDQWKNYSETDSMREYLITLYNMIEMRKFNVRDEMYVPTDVAKNSKLNITTFASYYVYKEVKKELKLQGTTNIPYYKQVLNFLRDNNLVRMEGKETVVSRRIGTSQPRVITLFWKKFRKLLKEEYGYEV